MAFIVYPMHFPPIFISIHFCVQYFRGIKVVMCVVDVGSFASKCLTASHENKKTPTWTTTTPAASAQINEQDERTEKGDVARRKRKKWWWWRRRRRRWKKQQVHAIPSCTTDCLIHFNVQYKIMFDYISDVFTRLVHEMHAQLAFSSSYFNSIYMRVEQCIFILGPCGNCKMQWILCTAKNPRASIGSFVVHTKTYDVSEKSKSAWSEPRWGHTRRIIYHLDAIEGFVFFILTLVVLSFITCFLCTQILACTHFFA